MRPIQQSLLSRVVGLCLLYSSLLLTATADHEVIRDSTTGVVTRVICKYPERESCMMPYRETNTT